MTVLGRSLFWTVALCLPASTSHAHIKLLKPAAWVTTDATGNPQKTGPCGTADAGSAATNTVTTFTAGEEITVEWTETVDHPGHFRIALAKNRGDLKDPDLKPAAGTCDYPAGSVPTEPHDNVLLDNLYPTTAYGGTKSYSQTVKLPDEPCEKCTLQLIQWMTKHPPACIYYQCADIRIVKKGSEAAGSTAGAAAGSGGKGGAAVPESEDSGGGCTLTAARESHARSLLALCAALTLFVRRRARTRGAMPPK